MKTSHFLLLFVVLFAFSFCQKKNDTITFEVHYITTLMIPANTPANELLDFQREIESDIQDLTFGNGSTRDLIEHIELSATTMSIISPTGETFSPIKSSVVSIKAINESLQEIAESMDIPDDEDAQLELNVTNSSNLKDYVNKFTFNLRTSIETDELITQDLEIEVQTTFIVRAEKF
jgi:hypothetical protein